MAKIDNDDDDWDNYASSVDSGEECDAQDPGGSSEPHPAGVSFATSAPSCPHVAAPVVARSIPRHSGADSPVGSSLY